MSKLAFIGNEKRNIIDIKVSAKLSIIDSSIDKMLLRDDSHIAYFKRLGYKFCPHIKLRTNGNSFKLKEGEALIDMNRWGVIKELYFIMLQLELSPRTKINIFNAMAYLIKHCDENEIKDFYSAHAIKSLISNLKSRLHQGIRNKTIMAIQYSIKVILFEINPSIIDDLKNDFLMLPDDSLPSKPYSDDELKQTVRALYKIFNAYRQCIFANTVPEIHPLYDEELLKNNNNFTCHTESSWRKKLYSEKSHDTWRNDLIKTAFYLTSFYTGANESALINLKLTDISTETFNQVSSGNFILKTVKERQKGKKNLLSIGFSRRAKEFFETWLLLRKIIIKQECDYVFPQLVKGKVTKTRPSSAATTLNNTLGLLGFPLLSTQRFRKTKAILIMRATESVFSVAEGLNNSPKTVSKHYANGVPEIMEFSLAGALDVRQRTVQGELLSKAIGESSYNFSDPIREQFYVQNKLDIPHTLSNGLRCKDSFGEKAKLLKNALVKAGLAKQKNKVACHKFLECFGCPHHAVIAEVEDIWLMLSFRDVILEVSCQPSINTIPTNILTKVVHTIESILERLKQGFTKEYKEAETKYSSSPHPLWSDKNDLNFLLELY